MLFWQVKIIKPTLSFPHSYGKMAELVLRQFTFQNPTRSYIVYCIIQTATWNHNDKAECKFKTSEMKWWCDVLLWTVFSLWNKLEDETWQHRASRTIYINFMPSVAIYLSWYIAWRMCVCMTWQFFDMQVSVPISILALLWPLS